MILLLGGVCNSAEMFCKSLNFVKFYSFVKQVGAVANHAQQRGIEVTKKSVIAS
jgi:hypothetical protein